MWSVCKEILVKLRVFGFREYLRGADWQLEAMPVYQGTASWQTAKSIKAVWQVQARV